MISGVDANRVKIMDVPLDRVRPKVYVRRILGDIERLAVSIKRNGILEPLVVSESDGGYYEVVLGFRRYLAAMKLGLSIVPVINVGKMEIIKALEMIWEDERSRQSLTLDERCILVALLVEEYGVREVGRRYGLSPSTVETMAMAGKTFAGVWRVVRTSDGSNTLKFNFDFKVKLKLAEEVCRVVSRAGYVGEEFKKVAGKAYLSLVDLPTKISIEILREWAKRPTLDHLEELIAEFKRKDAFKRPFFNIPRLKERVPIELDGNKSLEKLLIDAAWDHKASYNIVGQVSMDIIEFNGKYADISCIICPRCSKPIRCRICGSIVNCLCAYPHNLVRNRRYRYYDAEGSRS